MNKQGTVNPRNIQEAYINSVGAAAVGVESVRSTTVHHALRKSGRRKAIAERKPQKSYWMLAIAKINNKRPSSVESKTKLPIPLAKHYIWKKHSTLN